MVGYEDILLVQRIKQGDEEAFTELVDMYKRKAFGVAYHFLHNIEDAREISQEAFIKVYRKIHIFKEEASFYTWFYRILVNLCIDYIRSKKLFMTIPFSQMRRQNDTDTESREPQIEDCTQTSPLDTLSSREIGEHITKALESLSEKQRTVFILRNYEKLSLSEIAGVLHCATGTVKSHLARAIATLQEKLQNLRKETEVKGGGDNE